MKTLTLTLLGALALSAGPVAYGWDGYGGSGGRIEEHNGKWEQSGGGGSEKSGGWEKGGGGSAKSGGWEKSGGGGWENGRGGSEKRGGDRWEKRGGGDVVIIKSSGHREHPDPNYDRGHRGRGEVVIIKEGEHRHHDHDRDHRGRGEVVVVTPKGHREQTSRVSRKTFVAEREGDYHKHHGGSEVIIIKRGGDHWGHGDRWEHSDHPERRY